MGEEGLVPLEKLRGQEALVLEVATSAYLGRVYRVIDGRNAWWNTWVRRWYQDEIYASLNAARHAVEGMRVQGSTWTIEEVPVCVFLGSQHALVVGEIHSREPLTKHGYSPVCKPFLNDLAVVFQRPANDNILCLAAQGIEIQRFAGRAGLFSSVSEGGRFPLWWTKSDVEWRTGGLETILKTYKESLRSALSSGSG